ncbi:hypothetical protein PRVXH_000527 [Proteinivorax hydrogeniformans]|uniref:Uncharacterized protein n=1 Tax=Proteinivorax hydrogeniformans TaxID=1826727 RepID=A0AAU8HV23_9FIRM
MLKRLILWVMAAILLFFIVAELVLPLIIERSVASKIEEYDHSYKKIDITSPRPYMFSLLRSNFKGTITLRNVSLKGFEFDLVKMNFNTGLLSHFTGDFEASISHKQLEDMLKQEFGHDIKAELTQGEMKIYLEQQVMFTELSLALQGNLEVKDGRLKYNIHEINSNIGKITGSFANEILNSLPLYYPLPSDEDLSIDDVKIIDNFIIISGELK